MIFSGVQPWTILDFPEHIACILFTPGCNFRCGYCYNSEFVLPCKIKTISHSFLSEKTILRFLQTRRNFLDGVVISGGEPLLHSGLETFITLVRALGFKIKLDTNGSFPDRLDVLLYKQLLDYVAMDIKAPLSHYALLTKNNDSFLLKKIKKSIEILKQSGIPYEFRSTLISGYHKKEDVQAMATLISGAPLYYLQNYTAQRSLLDPSFSRYSSFSSQELQEFKKIAQTQVQKCFIR